MAAVYKEPSLLFQEIPLYGDLTRKSPVQEIYVHEGLDDIVGIENASFSERAGGVSLDLGGITRVICWQTSDNALELYEYSLDADLHSNHFSIIFEDSKILPETHITVKNHHLVIVCCTIHAAHFISLDISQQSRTIKDARPGQSHSSLLKCLPQFDFDNPQYNYAFGHQVSGIAHGFTAETMLPGNVNVVNPLLGTIIAITTSGGNLVVVRMPGKGSPSHFMINQSSRMSRLWSGINPWADSGGSETVEDIKMLLLADNPCVVAICRDKRLRIWSCRTHELLASETIAEHLPEFSKKVESHAFVYKIRTCIGANLVSIYVGMLDECRLLQFKIQCKSDNGILLEFVSSVAALLASPNFPSRHLVDYALTSKTVLLALWHDVEDVDSLTACNVNSANWHEVATYPAPVTEIPVQHYQDIREAYMDYIFHPGRFSPLAIARALSIHRRTSPIPSSSMQQQNLKQKVSSHIQNEIQGQLPEEENNDDFAALQETVWSGFYQTCIQYQQVVSRCLGMTVPLYSSASSSAQLNISLVKKGHISVLTPVSSLEAVCRGADPSIFVGILPEDAYTDTNLRDLSQLLECLGVFHGLLGIEFLESVQQSLSLSGAGPADVVEGVLNDVYDMIRRPEDINGPEAMLVDIYDVSAAIELLIIVLEPSEFGVDFEVSDVSSWPTGSNGIELLARCVFRHVENRFQLTILLYILSCVLENDKDQRMILPSRIGTYVQAYQATCWLSIVKKQNISQTTLEKTMQNLSVYDTGDGSTRPQSSYSNSSDITLLEYFIADEGGKLLQAFFKAVKTPEFQISPKTPEYFSRPYDGLSLHQKIVPAAVNFFVYLMWPLGPTLTFPDFLLSRGHLTVLQRYLLRELGGWCERCPGSRAYMLAHCHLHQGNYDKAVRYFVTAAPGIGKEEYLINKLLQEEEDGLPPKILEVIYYTKVLPIFEKLDLPEQVITLAEHAVEVAKNNENDPNVPILWSSIFRQNNSLLRHSASFKAILSNPDPDHRKDCLRALAVCLCECKQYKTLVEFEYGELEDDLVSILEHRARGTDLAFSNHKYYDILYAFHIHRGSYRRAASSMYEQGYRLGCEMSPSGPAAVNNASMLERQAACFLACINCLYLVSEDDRWILHPTAAQNNDGIQQQLGYRSPKRQYDGEEVERSSSRKVVIKELVDIEKETLLIETRVKLELLNKDKKQPLTGPLTTPVEIVALLCRVGLYDDAILQSSKFDLSLVPIFESLASKCVRLSYADERGKAEGWNWLQENETAKTHCFSAASSSSQWSAAGAAYRLLQVYLETHGDADLKGTMYYNAAAKALFSLSTALPAWFTNSYKLRNCPELLRLLVCFDRLDEATYLAIELINAAMGVGPELFGIKESLSGSGKPTWLPYTIIEQLLHVLDESRMHDVFDKLYHQLNDALEEYLYAVETVSHDMIQAAQQRAIPSS